MTEEFPWIEIGQEPEERQIRKIEEFLPRISRRARITEKSRKENQKTFYHGYTARKAATEDKELTQKFLHEETETEKKPGKGKNFTAETPGTQRKQHEHNFAENEEF